MNCRRDSTNNKLKKMKTKILIIAIAICGFMLFPCQVSAQKRIVINSSPAGAEILINNAKINQQTPAVIKNPGKKSFMVICKKEGYEDAKQLVLKRKNFDNKKVYPDELNLILTPTLQKVDPTVPKGGEKERVSRNNPGETSLERTIIRWYFESQPQGARIFWRVISSNPAEVKNTNELWLGNTPFEETRSFNIQGLTYENSRDVQIEIKVRRQGYLDQTKRFNVRQAIDQQEISSFFDMIKAEE